MWRDGLSQAVMPGTTLTSAAKHGMLFRDEGLVPKRISLVHDVGLGQPVVRVRVAEARGGSGIHRLLQRPS